jgi:Flp pilus assembly protein TadG
MKEDLIMIRPFVSAPRRSRQGVATVEFALLLPFLCLIFIGTVDFCRIFYYSLTVSNCARNAALYGSADLTHALDTSGIQAAAHVDAANLDIYSMNVTSTTYPATNPTRVDVTVTYPFTTITNYPGIPRQTNIRRTVKMSILPQTPDFD